MDRIKLGVIGAGLAWERLHYPAIARLMDKYEVTAVCDKDINKAAKAASCFNLPENAVYCDYRTMLSKAADVDAVDLMVPIPENYEAAKAVIESGRDLIAEKPFAATVDGAKKLIKLANSKSIKVLVAENYRYDEENVMIKNMLEERKIGNAVYFIDNIVCEFQKDMLGSSFSSTEWRQHPDFTGGIFLDSAVHNIARMRFLFGNVQSIYASGRPTDVDFAPYSCINALLTFKDRITGHFAYFNIGKETQSPPVGLRIFGTGGEIYLENRNCGFVNVSYKDGSHEAIPYKPGEGYYNELNNFYNAVKNSEKIVSTPEKELGDIQVIYDILSSIEKEKPIKAKNSYSSETAASFF